MNILKGIFEFIMDILETIVFIGSLFMVIYLYIIQPNLIKGLSMEPNFHTGEYIFVSKITYKFRPLERGDVIVLLSPKDNEVEFIKRIIGLPNDKLLFQNGEVFVNGIQLKEPYLASKTPVWQQGYVKEGVPFTVGSDEVFVLGDNRPQSSDSREFGPVPLTNVIGHVFFRYFPVSRMGPVNNPLPKSLQTSQKLSLAPSTRRLVSA